MQHYPSMRAGATTSTRIRSAMPDAHPAVFGNLITLRQIGTSRTPTKRRDVVLAQCRSTMGHRRYERAPSGRLSAAAARNGAPCEIDPETFETFDLGTFRRSKTVPGFLTRPIVDLHPESS